jgi:4-aminobutyrate aminotransferase
MNRATVAVQVKVQPPGPRAKRWAAYHLAAAAPATYVESFIWDRTAPAIGPFCTDADGNVLLDFASHIGTAALGYNHPALLEEAARCAGVDPDRYAGTDFIAAAGPDPERTAFPTPAHLQHKLLELTAPFNFGRVFLSNSGTEAVENAIKCCYAARRAARYGITFDGAFHGRTLGALSLNRSKATHRAFFPQIPQILSLPFCTCAAACRCGWEEADGTSRLARLLAPESGIVRPEEVAFIIFEPVQGEGGYRVPRKAFLQEVARLARQHGIPLIADEVQSGMGRTGRWWAIEHFGVTPDLITAGKALRVAATVGRADLFPAEAGRLGGTWAEGNALSTAVGYRTIAVIEREGLLQNATRMGERLLAGLRDLAGRHRHVVESRGLGLMAAIELDTRERRGAAVRAALARGLVTLGCGVKAIRFLPPLDVTEREIGIALELLDAALGAAAT